MIIKNNVNMATTALTFSKSGDIYVATATVSSDYALHIERKYIGLFRISQARREGDRYMECQLPENLSKGNFTVLDWSFGHGVYPLNIRIESSSEVTKASITTEGEAG